MLQKFPSQDKVSRFINSQLLCVFCREVMEDHNHLFFNCKFMEEHWLKAMHICNESWSSQPWDSTIQWVTSNWTSNNLRSLERRWLLVAVVYTIWKEGTSELSKINPDHYKSYGPRLLSLSETNHGDSR